MGELLPPLDSSINNYVFRNYDNTMYEESLYSKVLKLSKVGKALYSEYHMDMHSVFAQHDMDSLFGASFSPYTICSLQNNKVIAAPKEAREQLIAVVKKHERFFAYCKAVSKLLRESKRICTQAYKTLGIPLPVALHVEREAFIYLFKQDEALYCNFLMNTVSNVTQYEDIKSYVEKQPDLTQQAKFKKALSTLHEETYIYNLTR